MDDLEDTTDVDPRFQRTVTIHGREFQQYALENDVHWMPIDEPQIERLHTIHRSLQHLFDQKLIFPPLLVTPQRILDLGFGTGIWAVQVAEKYPRCEVIGIDISAHMLPDDLPDNFEPQLDDLNNRFTFPSNHFDVVHARFVGLGINKERWPSLLRDIMRVLKPGGWVQIIESYTQIQSDNGSINDESASRKWSANYLTALETIKDPRVPMQLQTMFHAYGFADVGGRMVPLPLSDWSRDPREQKLGEVFKEKVTEQTLHTLGVYPFTTKLGMTLEAAQDLCAKAAAEATDPSYKAYVPIYVCIARKPS